MMEMRGVEPYIPGKAVRSFSRCGLNSRWRVLGVEAYVEETDEGLGGHLDVVLVGALAVFERHALGTQRQDELSLRFGRSDVEHFAAASRLGAEADDEFGVVEEVGHGVSLQRHGLVERLLDVPGV